MVEALRRSVRRPKDVLGVTTYVRRISAERPPRVIQLRMKRLGRTTVHARSISHTTT